MSVPSKPHLKSTASCDKKAERHIRSSYYWQLQVATPSVRTCEQAAAGRSMPLVVADLFVPVFDRLQGKPSQLQELSECVQLIRNKQDVPWHDRIARLEQLMASD